MFSLLAMLLAAFLCLHDCECSKATHVMNWCGKKLNPLQLAKSAKFAADLFASCKEQFKMMAADPTIVKELKRVCVALRVCYAYADDLKESGEFYPAFLNCLKKLIQGMETTSITMATGYQVKISTIIDETQKCHPMNMPKDEAYLLGMLAWFGDFVKA
ncbi:hypothetical protein MRX96_012985 [Rhipicephalus microplus]